MGIVATAQAPTGVSEKFSPASKFIAEVVYDSVGRTMDITFKSGSKIRYLNVSPVTIDSFKSSPTIDSFYSRGIKGALMSVKLVDAGIGREKSTPLKKVKEVNTLDAGIRKQQQRNVPGTVARAFGQSSFAVR